MEEQILLVASNIGKQKIFNDRRVTGLTDLLS